MQYVDGYVLPVPTRKVAAYRRLSQKAARIWREYGALEFRETVGDDLENPYGTSFPDLVKLKRGETVVFSWIVFKSRAHRDAVNKKVMSDRRLAEMMEMKNLPFDPKRMAWGGFRTIVDR